MPSAAPRDPALFPRLASLLAAIAVLWPLAQAAGVRPGALFDDGNLKVVGGFLAGFQPPASDAFFLTLLARATLETLAIATAGLTLAVLLALPLAYRVSNAARERAKLRPGTRLVLTVLRGVPELVWALVFVRIFGLGPAAGAPTDPRPDQGEWFGSDLTMSPAIFAAVSIACFEFALRVSAVIEPRHRSFLVAGSSKNTTTEPSVMRRSGGSSDAAGIGGALALSTAFGDGALKRGSFDVTYTRDPTTW